MVGPFPTEGRTNLTFLSQFPEKLTGKQIPFLGKIAHLMLEERGALASPAGARPRRGGGLGRKRGGTLPSGY